MGAEGGSGEGARCAGSAAPGSSPSPARIRGTEHSRTVHPILVLYRLGCGNARLTHCSLAPSLSCCAWAASAQASLDNLHAAAAAGHAATEHRRPAPKHQHAQVSGCTRPRQCIWQANTPSGSRSGSGRVVSSCAAELSHFLDAERSLGQNNIDQCLFWDSRRAGGRPYPLPLPPPFPLPIVTLVVALGERGLPCVAARV
jgi:hypothetical protein